jgi:IS605 OrfB family transposase
MVTSSMKIKIIPVDVISKNWIFDIFNVSYKILNRAYDISRMLHQYPVIMSPVTPPKSQVYNLTTQEFPKVITTYLRDWVYQAENNYKSDVKAGLLSGKRSPRLYKKYGATRFQFLKNSNPKLIKENGDFFILINSRTNIKFKIIFDKKTGHLKTMLNRFLDLENKKYNLNSTFLIKYTNRKELMLILSYEQDIQGYVGIDNRVMGIDMGVRRFISLRINDIPSYQKSIHSEKLVQQKYGIAMKNKRVQESSVLAKSGHGRTRKMQVYNKVKDSETSFTDNVLDKLSKEVIESAAKLKVQQINMERLDKNSMKEQNSYLGRYWGVMTLMNLIEQKAIKRGIIIKYIDPYHTSQICSCCGSIGERNGAEFKCLSSKCDDFNKVIDSDYNAAMNIATSVDYLDDASKGKYYLNKTEKVLEEVL